MLAQTDVTVSDVIVLLYHNLRVAAPRVEDVKGWFTTITGPRRRQLSLVAPFHLVIGWSQVEHEKLWLSGRKLQSKLQIDISKHSKDAMLYNSSSVEIRVLSVKQRCVRRES